jgi:hypothetical protein
MQPQRAALHSIFTWVKNDPISAAPLNTSIINSMRFMLEAAGLSSEGMMGALVLQAMALKWAEVVAIWLGDDEPLQDKTCAALHRMLDEGALWVNRLNAFESNASRLFKNLCADRRTTGNDRNDPSRPEYEHWRADHRAD